MSGRNSVSGFAYSGQEIEMDPWRQSNEITTPSAEQRMTLRAEPAVTEATARDLAPAPTPAGSSVLSLSAFLSQVDALKASVKALDILGVQMEAIHERIGGFGFLQGVVKTTIPGKSPEKQELDSAIAGVLTQATQQAALIDLAYQSSGLITSVYGQLLALRADVEGSSPKGRDIKAKKLALQSALSIFKSSLLSYTTEQCTYKFLLKKQIRTGYLSLRPNASETEVQKAVEDKTDWGMGIVGRDPVINFVERLGWEDPNSSVDDVEFYSVNGGWEETTPEVKDVLDRIAGLRGELKRTEEIIIDCRGLYREIEEQDRISKRDSLTIQRGSLDAGFRGFTIGRRERGTRRGAEDPQVFCCGLLGQDMFRGWARGILIAVCRTGVGALAFFNHVRRVF
ncbi:hypothetical protein V8F20_012344 [Naviculisporaceae sp. PSN 640]